MIIPHYSQHMEKHKPCSSHHQADVHLYSYIHLYPKHHHLIPMISPPFKAARAQQPRQLGAPLRQRRPRRNACGRLRAEDAGRHHAAQQQRQHRVLGRQDAELPGGKQNYDNYGGFLTISIDIYRLLTIDYVS